MVIQQSKRAAGQQRGACQGCGGATQETSGGNACAAGGGERQINALCDAVATYVPECAAQVYLADVKGYANLLPEG